jgi:acetyltransferase EpsM
MIGDANPRTKRNILTRLKMRGRFLSLVHPLSFVEPTASTAEGAVVYPFEIVHTDAKVASVVVVNSYSTFEYAPIVGDWSMLSGNVYITGGVDIGQSVFFGNNATVLPSATIESFSKVGASSCVVRDVKEVDSFFGVPAKNQ